MNKYSCTTSNLRFFSTCLAKQLLHILNSSLCWTKAHTLLINISLHHWYPAAKHSAIPFTNNFKSPPARKLLAAIFGVQF